MIILTKKELIEAFQCAFMEYYDLGPNDSNRETEDMEALQNQIMDKVMDACLKYPHAEVRPRPWRVL